MSACQAWAAAAHTLGIPVVLDGGSWKPGTDQLLNFVDIAICSADFLPPGCTSEDTVIQYLQSAGVRQIAITHGATPVRFVDTSHSGLIEVPKSTQSIRPAPETSSMALSASTLLMVPASSKPCAKQPASPRRPASSTEPGNG